MSQNPLFDQPAFCPKSSDDGQSGEEVLNAWIVWQGHTIDYRPYSKDYITAEEKARSEKRGIWSGGFALPWLWRCG
jgi:endonuclease YncB( thermonuclease family)